MTDPLLVGVVCGLIGLVLGVLAMVAFRVSERSRVVHVSVGEPTLPDGVAEVLSVIGRAYVLVDAVNGVVRANPSAYAFGLVRGHHLVHPELRTLTDRVRTEGIIVDRRFELPRGPLGQGVLLVQLRVAPLADEYILVLADDRTEISRTEAMRHDFVANVSHELKTPVGAISLLAEALDDAADDEDAVRRFAGRMSIESARLAALVQDIIELSRLQGKDTVRAGEPVNLTQIVSEAVDRSRMQAESRDITIRVAGTAPAPVYGDHDQLMTALRNLIDNAVRYSPDGTAVGVGLKSVRGLAQVSVTDQGVGIPEEEQDRIFERFYRIDAARSRQTGGTGLGLSIVKHVISNHGGEVTVWSQPGRGSTFTVRLPEMEPDAGQHHVQSDRVQPESRRAPGVPAAGEGAQS